MLIGVALLYGGGELLVRNAVHLARRFGVSSLVIGLTVVAFGTSSPELAATLIANLQGAAGVALGNVIGSNIANIGLILGMTALAYPLVASRSFMRRDVPLTLAVALILFPLFWDGQLGRVEAAILLTALLAYLWFLFRYDEIPHGEALEKATPSVPTWRALLGAGLGIALLVVGARALVEGAVAIAESFGVSERVIGLTLVAVGTSLPELASSLVAALRRQTAIILGNIAGSNVFNILAILGVTAFVKPLPGTLAELSFDLWVMAGFSVLLALLMARGLRLGRLGGGVLLLSYGAYVVTLFY